MKKLLHRSAFWIGAFGGIFLLTQDFLFVKWDARPMLMGLPNWLFWFVAVHVIFIVAFYFFTKSYWKE
ncbi:MAG TPA: hypothetical protein ENJ20_01530 [Bacteroidetes bacterium]|nr:hypothetical protein [Bacteroidota bacterium]